MRERGFDFEVATRVFDGRLLQEEDYRRDYRERRIVATGKIETGLFVQWRGNQRRIISARPANRRERDDYHKAYPE